MRVCNWPHEVECGREPNLPAKPDMGQHHNPPPAQQKPSVKPLKPSNAPTPNHDHQLHAVPDDYYPGIQINPNIPSGYLCTLDGFYFVPHPTVCERYFICVDRRIHFHQCGSGIHWDYVYEQCNFPQRTYCYANATHVPTYVPISGGTSEELAWHPVGDVRPEIESPAPEIQPPVKRTTTSIPTTTTAPTRPPTTTTRMPTTTTTTPTRAPYYESVEDERSEALSKLTHHRNSKITWMQIIGIRSRLSSEHSLHGTQRLSHVLHLHCKSTDSYLLPRKNGVEQNANAMYRGIVTCVWFTANTLTPITIIWLFDKQINYDITSMY